ncbi:MAG TPA: hypothetical protein VNU19_08980 [Candidatus Acidoferrum sp.]|jgi:hypothetical protein|nr:hypothetical protein [Candidatus Acidoferrum sp.]
MTYPLKRIALAATFLMIAASCGGGGTPVVEATPSPVEGALGQGLIAYVAGNGLGVLDPTTGKSTLVSPLPAGGAFRIAGPVWAAAPGISHPVLYFTIHDDRPAETRDTTGVVPYDWLFRLDPFAGTIAPLAASYDFQSEGPFGIVANGHYLALTVGCCTSYEVDALDLTRSTAGIKVMTKPPTQAALFTEGAAPGDSGLVAVRAFATGAWYWLNLDANVLNPFPLKLGQDDGPIAISPDGTTAAVSRPDHGPVIEPINVAVPIAGATSSPATTPATGTPSPATAPRAVNSKLPHADALAWSPDASLLAMAVNGGIQIYRASGKDGTPPVKSYLANSGVSGVDWSGPIPGQSYASVKAAPGPQAAVDGLLNATKLPKAADSPAGRYLTKLYLWQFDSSKTSPIASITDATSSVLQQYPPIGAVVVFHHWAPSPSWALLGGCYRYRLVIKGSVPATASTFGLGSNALCKP